MVAEQGGAGNCERCVSEQFGDRVGVALIGVLCGCLSTMVGTGN